MLNKDFSYANITAASASQTEGVPYAAVIHALHHRDKLTYLKLSWAVSAASCLISEKLRFLQETRQSLKKKLDTFSLALTELQNMPAKNLTEEQFKKRGMLIQESTDTFRRLTKQISEVDRELMYQEDYCEDIQSKFRQKMSKGLEKIDKLESEKAEIIVDTLKTQGLDLGAHPDLKTSLKQALNDARVQEAYLQASGEQKSAGLFNKFKEWFK